MPYHRPHQRPPQPVVTDVQRFQMLQERELHRQRPLELRERTVVSPDVQRHQDRAAAAAAVVVGIFVVAVLVVVVARPAGHPRPPTFGRSPRRHRRTPRVPRGPPPERLVEYTQRVNLQYPIFVHRQRPAGPVEDVVPLVVQVEVRPPLRTLVGRELVLVRLLVQEVVAHVVQYERDGGVVVVAAEVGLVRSFQEGEEDVVPRNDVRGSSRGRHGGRRRIRGRGLPRGRLSGGSGERRPRRPCLLPLRRWGRDRERDILPFHLLHILLEGVVVVEVIVVLLVPEAVLAFLVRAVRQQEDSRADDERGEDRVQMSTFPGIAPPRAGGGGGGDRRTSEIIIARISVVRIEMPPSSSSSGPRSPRAIAATGSATRCCAAPALALSLRAAAAAIAAVRIITIPAPAVSAAPADAAPLVPESSLPPEPLPYHGAYRRPIPSHPRPRGRMRRPERMSRAHRFGDVAVGIVEGLALLP
mmetsp:Transcript_37080/g.89426  ORF Transcript_37080/g.89426 Transcript_37080/m.89426 type:complete len:471 (-) Transcript_37080:127-1539(-)